MKSIISSRREILMQVQGTNVVSILLGAPPSNPLLTFSFSRSGPANKSNPSTPTLLLGVASVKFYIPPEDDIGYVLSLSRSKIPMLNMHHAGYSLFHPLRARRPHPLLARAQEVPQTRREQGRHPRPLLDSRLPQRRHQLLRLHNLLSRGLLAVLPPQIQARLVQEVQLLDVSRIGRWHPGHGFRVHVRRGWWKREGRGYAILGLGELFFRLPSVSSLANNRFAFFLLLESKRQSRLLFEVDMIYIEHSLFVCM